MNRENLKQARNFFQALPETPTFNMGHYFKDFSTGKYLQPQSPRPTCGFAACGVGWSPQIGPAFIALPTDYGWNEYGHRVYGLDHGDLIFAWLFNGNWDKVDNTVAGLVKRIQYVLDHWEAPENTFDQIHGDAPYYFETTS